MAEEDIFAKLQAKFGATLAGINDTSTLQEALMIANRATEEDTLEFLPRDRNGDILDPIRKEKKNSRGEVVKERVTVEDFIAQQQEPHKVMGQIISAFIREQIDPTPTESE